MAGGKNGTVDSYAGADSSAKGTANSAALGSMFPTDVQARITAANTAYWYGEALDAGTEENIQVGSHTPHYDAHPDVPDGTQVPEGAASGFVPNPSSPEDINAGTQLAPPDGYGLMPTDTYVPGDSKSANADGMSPKAQSTKTFEASRDRSGISGNGRVTTG